MVRVGWIGALILPVARRAAGLEPLHHLQQSEIHPAPIPFSPLLSQHRTLAKQMLKNTTVPRRPRRIVAMLMAQLTFKLATMTKTRKRSEYSACMPQLVRFVYPCRLYFQFPAFLAFMPFFAVFL